ncbi:MAG TPA: CRTAC1 family protein, partial [Rhodothermales bacterium]
DLDLLLAPVAGQPAVLRNNGDGTFSPVSAFAEVSGLRDFAWADLDADADPDAALIDELGAMHVYLNERGGVFRQTGSQTRFGVASIATADVDADGRFDLLTRTANGAVMTSDNAQAMIEAGGGSGRIVVADLDNNGALDVVAGAEGGSGIRLRENEPGANGLRLNVAEYVVDAADLDADGRVDLLAVGPSGPVILHNEGTADYRWQVVRPRSAQATGDQRINSFGIGGQVEVRAGLLFQKQVIDAPQLHFGLGTQDGTDVARIVWPNGDVQAEFDLEPDQPVLTQQRLKGSCPWLFTFDGQGMTFVTDFIWRSPLGLAINGQEQAGVVLTGDRVKIDGNQLVPRDGIYDVRITAELWETHFFDQVSLIAVDHPAGTEVFVDERFSIPAPDLTPRLMKPLQKVQAAYDDKGGDVSDVVAEVDERYLGTFERGRYQGVAADHYVEVWLGPEVPRTGTIWLVAQGWVRPTDSSVNVAMSQGVNPHPSSIRLEAQAANGTWREVASNLGFPAGKTKSMTIPIGDVLAQYPSGRLRLRTNLEIYWDAISWAEGLPQDQMKLTEIQASVADLRYRGYSEVTVADSASPEIPHYDRFRSASRQWYDLEGFYTRFGDIRELLAEVDDRYVIMNAGDEMRFEFPELPPPADGMVRDYLLQGDGWVKDGDYNTAFSRTVQPLPLHRDTAYRGPLLPLDKDPGYRDHPQDWETYHTRYVAPDGFATALAPRD